MRESYGIWAHECFTWADLNEFTSARKPAKLGERVQHSREFIDVVAALKTLSERQLRAVLAACRQPLRPTWAQLGEISSKGQTDAGQKAEQLIADAIVDLVEIRLIPSSAQAPKTSR